MTVISALVLDSASVTVVAEDTLSPFSGAGVGDLDDKILVLALRRGRACRPGRGRFCAMCHLKAFISVSGRGWGACAPPALRVHAWSAVSDGFVSESKWTPFLGKYDLPLSDGFLMGSSSGVPWSSLSSSMYKLRSFSSISFADGTGVSELFVWGERVRNLDAREHLQISQIEDSV
jgi:hypothetical protein